MRCLGCLTILLLLVISAAAFIFCQVLVLRAGRGRIYTAVAMLPARETGVLLGAPRLRRDKRENPFFNRRVEAAAELYLHGKVRRLLVSGNGIQPGGTEPADMKNALIARGVPGSAILLDGSSLRTLDSIVRAGKVFGCRRFTVISQRGHDCRALFIADHYGINAIAFAARDVPLRKSLPAHVHEWLARVKAVLDLYILHTQPRHLGACLRLRRLEDAPGELVQYDQLCQRNARASGRPR